MSTLLTSLQQQWQQSRAQLAANPRLAWGLWCILLLALLYTNLLLSDQRSQLTTQLVGLHLEQQDAAQLNQGISWAEREQQTQQALKEQANRFGQADSESLARAEVQAKLGELARQNGVERSRVEVSAAPQADADSSLVPLQVQLNGRLTGDQLLTLLAELEQNTPYYRIESLVTTQGPRSNTLNLDLLATVWYRPWEASQ